MATAYADFLLSDGDLDLSSGDVEVIDSNLTSLKQRLDLRFATWQTEWMYDESYGTPYRDYIGIATDKSTLDQEIKRQILKEPDVVEISNLYSAINKTVRLYTFIAEVSTNETTLSYSLNLKDDFTYEIPSYSSGCDKIVEYQYWSSAPYDLLMTDKVDLSIASTHGSMLDPLKTSEAVALTLNPLTGSLKDPISYLPDTEYIDAGSAIMSMTLTSILSPEYNAGYEYMNASSVITSMTLTDTLVTYNHPTEDYVSASSAITSMTLTG